MDATLLLGLVGVYVLGVVGIVVVGTWVETPNDMAVPDTLEERLAGARRAIAPVDDTTTAPAYFVRGTRKRLADRRRVRGL